MVKPPEVQHEISHDHLSNSGTSDVPVREGKGHQFQTSLAVLGVVYGDLGTSCIYALYAVFTSDNAQLEPSPMNVLGILSLVFWTLLIVVSLKYMVFILRADNHGEGGTFALIALLRPWKRTEQTPRRMLVLAGLAGAAMLYAGVMITPAISILSAVEGLKIASPDMKAYVVPATLVILVLLFAVQHLGTAKIGAAFGPVMTLWFLVIAALGVYGILKTPDVLWAIDPRYAVRFFYQNGSHGFLVLFAVFLVTTGAEALYADVGHFGRKPIRQVWFLFVLPALLLNYFGQAAMILHDPKAAAQPFYHLIPNVFLYPVVVLATMATIIASQAAITGAFSMTRQAARLGMMPRFRVVQTSEETLGQIYVPLVNWILMIAAIILVVLFRSSDKLASTYGISISSAMVITTILAFVVARERSHWPLWAALLFLLGFLSVDLAYFGSNLLRIPHGGWFPVVVGLLFFTVMSTWRRGRELLTRQVDQKAKPVDELIQDLENNKIARVPGTAIFLTRRLDNTPPVLSRHIERNHALQEQVVLLTVLTEDVPRTTGEERTECEDLGKGFFRMVLHYGYMQGVNVPSELAAYTGKDFKIDLDNTTYYVEHQMTMSGRGHRDGMMVWRDHLLGFLMRNSVDATASYQIPIDKIVDMGLRIRI